jgi:hypothetical protein
MEDAGWQYVGRNDYRALRVPEMRNTLLLAGGVVLLGVIAIHGWRLLSSGNVAESPESLAAMALSASTPEAAEAAAVQLSQGGRPAREQMRRVLAESKRPEVRAACVRGLAELWDYNSMPALFKAMEDESQMVRARAGAAMRRLLKDDGGFRAEDPKEKRDQAIKQCRLCWTGYFSGTLPREYIREKMGEELRE